MPEQNEQDTTQEATVKIPTPEPFAIKNLAKKIAEIIGECRYVQKTGRNEFHKYNYATEADFLALLAPKLAEKGIAIFPAVVQAFRSEGPPTNSGKKQWITTVQVNFMIVDSESGETISSTFFGHGLDGEDKGIYKAYTGAQKYFLAKTFLIETGDDPERETKAEKEAAKKPEAAPVPADPEKQAALAAIKLAFKEAGLDTPEKMGPRCGHMQACFSTKKWKEIEKLDLQSLLDGLTLLTDRLAVKQKPPIEASPAREPGDDQAF